MALLFWTLVANILLFLLLLIHLQQRLHRFRRPRMPGQRVSRVVGRVEGPAEGLATVRRPAGEGGAMFLDGPLQLRTRHDSVRVVARLAVFEPGRGFRAAALSRGQVLTVDGTWTHLPRDEALYREPGCWRAMDAIRVVRGAWARPRTTAALVLCGLGLVAQLGTAGWILGEDSEQPAATPAVTLDCPAGTTQVRFVNPSGLSADHACLRPDGTRHGPWVKTQDDGSVLQRGQYEGGRRNGSWIRWDYLGRLLSAATYEDGVLHGGRQEWYPTGELKLRSHYWRGKLHGAWEGWSPGGKDTCQGSFRRGKPHGTWTRSWSGRQAQQDASAPVCGPASGADAQHRVDWHGFVSPPTRQLRWGPLALSIHNYNEGRLDGPFRLEFVNGEVARGHYRNGHLAGCWTINYPDNGLKLRRCWRRELPSERWQAWYPAGNPLAEFSFDGQGRLHGAWIIWHNNGQRAVVGQHRAGLEHGRWTVWDWRGERIASVRWDRGRALGPASAHRALKRICTNGVVDAGPGLRLGTPEVRGPLPRYYAERVLQRHTGHLRYCSLQYLDDSLWPGGRLVLRIEVAASGRVTRSGTDSSTFEQALLRSCIGHAPRDWLFPAARRPSSIAVTLWLRPPLVQKAPLACPWIWPG